MLNLKAFRSKAAGLPDLLNYAALVSEGVVQGKDGSLIAGFFYRGNDNAVSTHAEQNHITTIVNNYLARFGAGWAVWVDAARLDSPGYPTPESSHFPDPITALIDQERRHRFERASTHYESEYALVLQYLPPLRREAKLSELVYDDDRRAETGPGERQIEEFERRLQDLEEGFADLLHMRRMRTLQVTAGPGDTYASDELVNYLHFTLTGETIALRIPDCPMYLDAWLGTPELWPGDTPKLGKKFISCVAIEGMPGYTCPGVLDLLDNLALSYRWSTRFIFMEQHQADKALNSYRRKWQQKIRGFFSQVFKTQKGVINTDAVAMMQEAERAISEAKGGQVAYGYYTPVVVLMHEDRAFLEEQARYVRREIERKGFGARVETVNCIEAWLGSLPGHPYPNIRRPLIHTLNLADLLPLSSVWPGLRENPCDLYPAGSPPLMHTVTTGATPFRLNLHVGDVGHTLIFGPTGAGKSTLLATLHAQARRYKSGVLEDGSTRPMTITAFDKGRSLYALCKATGGAHYDIGGDDAPVVLMPLQNIDTERDMLWAEEWIATCFELQADRSPSPQEKMAIHQAMMLLREADAGDRTLTAYVSNIQDSYIRDALRYYTLEGPMGYIIDGQSNDVSISAYTVFEIEELMSLGDSHAIPVLLCLFRQFENSLKGQPAILSLDEAWVMLGHRVFKEKLREWLKELRKKNCLVMLATQSLSDAVNSGLLDVLLEQCPTKIMLPNNAATQTGTVDRPGPADLYRQFGMNDREIELLKMATPKRQYYYRSPLGRRIFELGLDPLTLSFVAVSDKVSIDQIKRLEYAYGDNWPLHWLQSKGVDYEQYAH